MRQAGKMHLVTPAASPGGILLAQAVPSRVVRKIEVILIADLGGEPACTYPPFGMGIAIDDFYWRNQSHWAVESVWAHEVCGARLPRVDRRG